MKKVMNKYYMFLKYILVAGLSFFIDITIFTILNTLLRCNFIARIISSFINYLLNKEKVFKSDESVSNTIIKYYILVVIQMFVSALLVTNFQKIFKINATFIKIPVEFFLFVCNYLIQKILIFKRGQNENNKK